MFTPEELDALIYLVGDHLDDLMDDLMFTDRGPELDVEIDLYEALLEKLMSLVNESDIET